MRVPKCLGMYISMSSECNGTLGGPPCLMRDRCVALTILYPRREDVIKVGKFWGYTSREIVQRLDEERARSRIHRGIPRVSGVIRNRFKPYPKIRGVHLWSWFVRRLEFESNRVVVDGGRGHADIGELYTEHRIACRVGGRISLYSTIGFASLRTRARTIVARFEPYTWGELTDREKRILRPYKGQEMSAVLDDHRKTSMAARAIARIADKKLPEELE